MTFVGEIQERIDGRRAKVFTASEIKQMVREGNPPSVEDVDVVTCGTMGVMSGTMAVLSIPVAGPGEFRRADTITINGVPGVPGPCPNESLGLVDCVVYGTSRRDRDYGGGHLFGDLVSGREAEVVVTADGKEHRRMLALKDMPFARMILTRCAFKNYTSFYNPSAEPVTTIFSGPEPLEGNMTNATVSGCGEINPVQNDPGLRFLRPGAAVLVNGAPGMVLGTGTRSTPGKPNLSVEADMHEMRADLMGGFRTSEGPECVISIAAALPITDEQALKDACVLDSEIPLPLADVRDRVPVCTDSYASVWKDIRVEEDRSRCLDCKRCVADRVCPRDAHPSRGIDRGLCMSCGLCVRACVGKVFSAELGEVNVNGTKVPVSVRQSSRDKAEAMCAELKQTVSEGDWKLRCFDGRL